MDLVEEFNSYKQQCQNMARVARDPDSNTTWTSMAQQWERLAERYRLEDDNQEAAPYFAPAHRPGPAAARGLMGCPMARILDNSDRNFSADPVDKSETEVLRRLLERSEVADLLDAAIRERVGRAIALAVFDPAKPGC